MREDKQLIVGAFYWVIPKAEPGAADNWEPGLEWQDEIQPARFNGWNADGEMLWNFLGVGGSSSWPVLWVGEVIGVPITAPGRGTTLTSTTPDETYRDWA